MAKMPDKKRARFDARVDNIGNVSEVSEEQLLTAQTQMHEEAGASCSLITRKSAETQTCEKSENCDCAAASGHGSLIDVCPNCRSLQLVGGVVRRAV